MVDVLIALFRMRVDSQSMDISGPFHRFLKRVVHKWSMRVEEALGGVLTDSCPDPSVSARVHPYMRSSRQKGSPVLKMSLVARFAARGSGYISAKDSPSLGSLGLVSQASSLAARTSNEYCTRFLMKTTQHMEQSLKVSNVINFAFDAAFVSEEHASWLNTYYHYYYYHSVLNAIVSVTACTLLFLICISNSKLVD